MSRYGTRDVPARGGALRVATWESDDVAAGAAPALTVLAVHGVTASHLSWALVAQQLTADPGVRVIAPDLRGRGASASLPGPWGMATHADDLIAVLDSLGAARADVVAGHSMGGFVAVALADRAPDRLARLVLVDGGIPLSPPPGLTPEQALAATLGPAAQRLTMTFDSPSAYRDFWRAHPAFATDWSDAVEAYVDYDLVPGPDGLRSSASYEAVAADSAQMGSGGDVERAWSELALPISFLRAPADLLARPGGLYSRDAVAEWCAEHPAMAWHDVDGVNHYTITLGDRGARAVAAALQAPADQAGRSIP